MYYLDSIVKDVLQNGNKHASEKFGIQPRTVNTIIACVTATMKKWYEHDDHQAITLARRTSVAPETLQRFVLRIGKNYQLITTQKKCKKVSLACLRKAYECFVIKEKKKIEDISDILDCNKIEVQQKIRCFGLKHKYIANQGYWSKTKRDIYKELISQHMTIKEMARIQKVEESTVRYFIRTYFFEEYLALNPEERKPTLDDLETVVKEGLTRHAMAAYYGMDESKVIGIIHTRGLYKEWRKNRFNPEQHKPFFQEIVRQGKSKQEIAEITGLCVSTVYEYISKYNLRKLYNSFHPVKRNYVELKDFVQKGASLQVMSEHYHVSKECIRQVLHSRGFHSAWKEKRQSLLPNRETHASLK